MKAIFIALALSLSVGSVGANAQETEIETLGLNHIGFAVSKLEKTAAFFTKTLGWREAGRRPDYPAIFVTNGEMFVTLWQVENPETAVAFDRRKNVGLHHMAITVKSLEALDALHEKFKADADIRVEFAPEFLGQGPTTHMMIREPSGLRLEFIVPASRIKQ